MCRTHHLIAEAPYRCALHYYVKMFQFLDSGRLNTVTVHQALSRILPFPQIPLVVFMLISFQFSDMLQHLG